MSEQLRVVAFLMKPDCYDHYVSLSRDGTCGHIEPLVTASSANAALAAKDARIAKLEAVIRRLDDATGIEATLGASLDKALKRGWTHLEACNVNGRQGVCHMLPPATSSISRAQIHNPDGTPNWDVFEADYAVILRDAGVWSDDRMTHYTGRFWHQAWATCEPYAWALDKEGQHIATGDKVLTVIPRPAATHSEDGRDEK